MAGAATVCLVSRQDNGLEGIAILQRHAHMLGQTPAGTRAVSLAGAGADSSAIGVRHL
jgi:hypothetical protein